MPLLNPFAADAFNLWHMGAAINRLPNNFGRLREMNLFPTKGLRGRELVIDEKNGKLNLLTALPPGSPGQKSGRGTRRARAFTIPHIPYDDFILPHEYANIRAFGTESSVQPFTQVMNEHLQSARNKHAITLEWLRMGALKGLIYDSDGATVIYDLHKEFVIKKKTIDFALNAAGTEVVTKCLEVKRHIERLLQGEVMSGIHVLVDKDFYDALTTHTKVAAAYARWRDGAMLRADMRERFPFAGLIFEEYEGYANDAAGVERKFIASKRAIAFPLGTQSTFKTYFAPADFIETANTIGRPLYAKSEPMEFNRGVKIHTQSNPLPLCMRPEIVVELTTP